MLHWRQIDGEWLVYDDGTGATHLLDHVSAATLTCFESCAERSMPELIRQLATDLALALKPDQAIAVVQQCCALGLLLPTASPLVPHAAA